MDSDIYLSVVFPGFREEAETREAARRAGAYFAFAGKAGETFTVSGNARPPETRGRYVLIDGAAFSTPIKEVEKLIGALEAGAVAAAGSRPSVVPCLRKKCGFNLFTAAAARALFAQGSSEDFLFGDGMLRTARKLGIKTVDVPVMWHRKTARK